MNPKTTNITSETVQLFRAFGLNINADIPLGQTLKPYSAPSDLIVQKGSVPLNKPPELLLHTPLVASSNNQVWTRIPGIIRAHAHLPRRILWQEEKLLPKEIVRELLLDNLLPAILLSQGLIVRRGWALCNTHQALLVIDLSLKLRDEVGPTLEKKGILELSNGLCVIGYSLEQGYKLESGLPRRLYYGIEKKHLPVESQRLRQQVAVYHQDDTAFFSSHAKPLSAILFLRSHNDDYKTADTTLIKGYHKTQLIYNGWPLLVEGCGPSKVQTLKEWSALANRIPFYGLNPGNDETSKGEIISTAINRLLS